jgi:hypothetical protein
MDTINFLALFPSLQKGVDYEIYRQGFQPWPGDEIEFNDCKQVEDLRTVPQNPWGEVVLAWHSQFINPIVIVCLSQKAMGLFEFAIDKKVGIVTWYLQRGPATQICYPNPIEQPKPPEPGPWASLKKLFNR